MDFLDDLRHALRTLLREPSFSATAVLILALGLGANTVVFSIVEGVLLRPLDYREPARLFAVEEIIPEVTQTLPVLPVNARHYLEWRKSCSSFEEVAIADGEELNLTGREPERLSAVRATASLFRLLGVEAQLGRTFAPDEDRPGNDAVAVISDSLWRRRFGADPGVVDRRIELNGRARRVIGVLPKGFRFHFGSDMLGGAPLTHAEVFVPLPIREDEIGWLGEHNYLGVARLRRGVSPEQATAELNLVQADIATRFEDPAKLHLLGKLVPLQEAVVGQGRSGILLLLGAVGVVLLIACVNLGNAMLVRATGRSREAAIRAALGASRARIFRGVVAESLVLAAGGAFAGLGLALVCLQSFSAVAPPALRRADEVSMNGAVLSFALGLLLVTALACSLLPAWHLMRRDPQESLRGVGRSPGEVRGKLQLRELLVGSEVALSVALLVVAGLLLTSFVRLGRVDPGFDSDKILTGEITLPEKRYADENERRRFFDALLDRVESEQGVVAAGLISVLPLRGRMWMDVVTVEGDTRPLGERPIAPYRPVSPHYFRAMGIPLRSGRTIEQTDAPRKVAVVSESSARRLWPGEEPIGKRFRRSDMEEAPFEVVGVVGDVRSAGLELEPEPIMYVPLWERAPKSVAIAIRTTSGPYAATGALRDSLRSLDRNVPISAVQSMAGIEKDALAEPRFRTFLVAGFAGSALILAVLGTYAALGYSVARRTGEIGIRMALGARPGEIRSMLVRQGLRPVVPGLSLGLLAALAIGRAISGLLYSVSGSDGSTYAAVALVTLVAASLACIVPALRASRAEPLKALRHD